MKKGINKTTFRLSFCAVVSALGTALMMVTSLVPVGAYALPCFAGILLVSIVIEYGKKWAFTSYAVISILSLILVGDKEAVVYFIMIFGYYPIIKNILEQKINTKILRYILKLLIFNVAIIISFFVVIFLLSVPVEEFSIMGVCVPWLFLVLGNFFFIIYDYAVTTLIVRYVQNLRNKIFKKN